MVQIYSRFNPPPKNYTEIVGASLTKQSFQAESDINNILKKYQKTGILTHVNQFGGKYMDLGSVEDYHSSMNRVVKAQEAFLTLPSSLREKFGNDPAAFLKFVGDEKNIPAMRELGLLKEDLSTPPEAAIKPSEEGVVEKS